MLLIGTPEAVSLRARLVREQEHEAGGVSAGRSGYETVSGAGEGGGKHGVSAGGFDPAQRQHGWGTLHRILPPLQPRKDKRRSV